MPLTRDGLIGAAREKADAAALCLEADLPSTAYHLAGLAVELALKAHIAAIFRAAELPDPRFVRSVYTHDLDELLTLSGLRDALASTEPGLGLAAHWSTLQAWRVDSRYEAIDRTAATAIVHAACGGEGVVAWLSSQRWADEQSRDGV